MFKKNKIQLDLGAGGDQGILAKKVEVLQAKLLTSEKLQSKLFDFISGFEDSVKEVVQKELSASEPDIVPQIEDKVAALVSEKLKEYPKTEDVNAHVDGLKEDLGKLIKSTRPEFDLSIIEDQIAEVVNERIRELKEELEKSAGPKETLEPAAISKLIEEKLSAELERLGKRPAEKKGGEGSLSSLEAQLRERVNKALSELHKQLDSNTKELEALREELHPVIHSGHRSKDTIELAPNTADLKSYKLSVNRKLKELSQQLDDMHSEITSQEYVGVLETEFRSKLELLNERLNAYEALGFTESGQQGSRVLDTIQGHKQEVEALKNYIGEALAKTPNLGQLEEIRKAIRELEPQVKATLNRLDRVEKVAKAPNIEPRLGMIRKEFADLKSSVGYLSREVAKLDGLANAISNLNKQTEAIKEGMSRHSKELSGLQSASKLRPVKKELSELRLAIGEVGKEVQGLSSGLDKVEGLVSSHKTALTKRTSTIHSEFKSFEEYCIDQIERTNKWIKFINKSLE
jgi:hypothetical protein